MTGWDSRPEWFLCCSIKNQLLIRGVTYVLSNNEPHSIKSAISKTSTLLWFFLNSSLLLGTLF